MPAARPAASIRRHLQATSLLAVLAGYVLLLLVNRQLSARLRHERHDAQVQETTRLLQQLLPHQTDTTSELQRHLADLASPSLLVWMVWLEPDRPASGPVILPSGAAFQSLHAGQELVRFLEHCSVFPPHLSISQRQVSKKQKPRARTRPQVFWVRPVFSKPCKREISHTHMTHSQ